LRACRTGIHAAMKECRVNSGTVRIEKQEIVAELSAAVLCRVAGKTSKHLGNSYHYIERYARGAHLTHGKGA